MVGSPFKTTIEAVEEILEKAPELQDAQAMDPIGKSRTFIHLFTNYLLKFI